MSPAYESKPFEVCVRNGGQVVLKSAEVVECNRNLQHIKPLVTGAGPDIGTEQNEKVPDESLPIMTSTEEAAVCPPRRSGRVSRSPRALADYVLS